MDFETIVQNFSPSSESPSKPNSRKSSKIAENESSDETPDDAGRRKQPAEKRAQAFSETDRSGEARGLDTEDVQSPKAVEVESKLREEFLEPDMREVRNVNRENDGGSDTNNGLKGTASKGPFKREPGFQMCQRLANTDYNHSLDEECHRIQANQELQASVAAFKHILIVKQAEILAEADKALDEIMCHESHLSSAKRVSWLSEDNHGDAPGDAEPWVSPILEAVSPPAMLQVVPAPPAVNTPATLHSAIQEGGVQAREEVQENLEQLVSSSNSPSLRSRKPSRSRSTSRSRSRRSWIPGQGVAQGGCQQTVKTKKNQTRPANPGLSREDKLQAKKEANQTLDAGIFREVNTNVAKIEAQNAIAGNLMEDTYKTTGWAQKIARNAMFEKITLCVILVNALWMAVDAELNDADMLTQADPGFIVVENLFCTYFTFEITVRFLAYIRTWVALRDAMFSFDLVLVILMILETWAMPVVDAVGGSGSSSFMANASILRVGRTLRVLRTARMARLVRMMPELMILVKGMMVACRSVLFTLILLLIIIYVFAIAFMQLSKDSAVRELFFDSMANAMLNLLLHCILPDQEPFVRALASVNWFLALLGLLFVLLGSVTVMNMLLGVLVEAVKTVSLVEREQLEVSFAKKVIWDLIQQENADEDGDNHISEEEFLTLLAKPQAARVLASLGVDVIGAIDYGRMLFEDGEPLTFADFMSGMLMLRGTNVTTVKDIVDLRKFVADEFSILHELMGEMASRASTPRPSPSNKSMDEEGTTSPRKAKFA